MDTRPSTLAGEIVVVEADRDLGQIIALTLAHHGATVRMYASLADAWEAADDVPALVVLDVGSAALDDWSALAALERHRRLGAAPLVLLSWTCPRLAEPASGSGARICVAKPFDARALDAAVAGMLAPGDGLGVAVPGAVDASARVAEAAASAAEPAPEPSVWPIVTAAAGLAAMVGFMIHPVYVLAGLIVLVGAILRWALEPPRDGVQVR